jgi:hypothetical protein
MNQDTINKLVSMIQALDGKIDTFKDEVESRFNNLEQRMSRVEEAIAGIARPALLDAPSRAPSPAVRRSGYGINPFPHRVANSTQQPARGTSDHRVNSLAKAIGSTFNASFLPFAIEHIAKKHQQKLANDKRHW